MPRVAYLRLPMAGNNDWYSPAGGNDPGFPRPFKSVAPPSTGPIHDIPDWKLPEKYKRKNWDTMADLRDVNPYPSTGYRDTHLKYEDGW